MRLKLILAILCFFLSSTLWAAEPVQFARVGPVEVGAGVSAAGGSATIGNTTVGGSSGVDYDTGKIECYGPFAVSNNGTVNTIYLYSSNSSATLDIAVGLYVDSSGSPGALLGTETRFTDAGTWAAGWKNFAVSYSVSNGSSYWICRNISEAGVYTRYYDASGGNRKYNWSTYADAWLNPLNPGGNADSVYFSAKMDMTW